MALFASGRDASLVRSINKELINRFIDNEIGIYKLVHNHSRENIYGESNTKQYYQPVRVPALILREQRETRNDDGLTDVYRTATFSFLRDTLKDLALVLQVGDIISYDSEYYEVDNVDSFEYWASRNPDLHLGFTLNEIREHGYNVSVIVDTHVTRVNRLNIVDQRAGLNDNNWLPTI